MAAVDLNLNPSDRQLAQFGVIGLVALPVLAWLFTGKPTPATWEATHTQWIGIFGGLGLLMGGMAAFKPSLLKWVFIAASLITFPIGFVVGEILMFTIYLIAFAPMALLFRIIGRDALEKQLDRNAETYWQAKAQPKDAASYFRQS